MLEKESIWIKNTIKKYFTETDFPLLNIGSSTEAFRNDVQPYINENIFKPLIEEGKLVIHTDMKADKGVDIVGDLNDLDFQEQLRKRGVKSVLCSNLLEHLTNPERICCSIEDLLDSGGLIILTVPRYYPYHKDPIDTLLRPNPEELALYFRNCEMINGEIVQEEGNYKGVLIQNKRYFVIMLIRWLLPFYKYKEWRYMIMDVFNWNKPFAVSCVLLRKK